MALDDRLSDLLVDWEQSQRDGREPTLEELCKDAPELLPVVRESIDSLKATRWMLEPDSAATSTDDRSTDGLRAALHDTELPASHLTVEQFAASIFQSGLLSPGEIYELNQRLTASDLPGEAREIASRLVTEGKLTRYQASVLLKASKDPLLIDNYVILDTLDTGGMGLVFKALHRSMNRVVALKSLPAAMMSARDTVKRFQREVHAAAALSHPNVVAAYDAHQSDEIAYLVLEYVDGTNLFRLVKDHGPLPVALAANYVRQAATGLAYLHSRGIIHRDVKPANLILADDGTVKLLDMGLVRFASAEDLSCAEMDQELTQAGIVIGTVAYMSPEQALDTRSADQRSDIYSLGCTLFFLLTGRSLYHEETGMKTLLAHREQPVPSIREFCDDAPVSLDAVFRTMVAKRPADRLQSMSEVVAAIDACVPGVAFNVPAATSLGKIAPSATAGTSRLARGWKQLRSNPLRMALTIALLATAAAGSTYLAGILIRIKTKQGTTEVHVDDPEAEVTVKKESDSKDFQSLIHGRKKRDLPSAGTPAPVYRAEAPATGPSMPLLVGAPPDLAIRIAGKLKPLGFKVRFERGSRAPEPSQNWHIASQDPPAGAPLQGGKPIVLRYYFVERVGKPNPTEQSPIDFEPKDSDIQAPPAKPREPEALNQQQHADAGKAWENVQKWKAKGLPVGIAIDCLEIIQKYPNTEFAAKAQEELAKLSPDDIQNARLMVFGLPELKRMMFRQPPEKERSPGSAAAAMQESVDRQVAKWVLSGRGNFVFLREAGQVGDLLQLPAGEIHVLGINNRRGVPVKFSNSDVERLASLPELLSLRLQSPTVTDEIVLRLKTLTKLKALSLIHARISDACLPALAGMSCLSFLDLSDTPITDAGLEQIAKIKSLNDLSLPAKNDPRNIESANLLYLGGIKEVPLPALILDNTRTTEAGVVKLRRALPNCNISHVITESPAQPPASPATASAETKESADRQIARWVLSNPGSVVWLKEDLSRPFPQMEQLPEGDIHLEGVTFGTVLRRPLGVSPGLPDEEMARLASLSELKWLILESPLVTDDVVRHLKRLSKLTQLSLANSKVTDACLPALVGLKRLSSLDLSRTAITDAGLEQLAKIQSLNDPSLIRQDPRRGDDRPTDHVRTSLPALLLNHTRTTETGVLRLQQALPNCTVFASHIYPRALPPKPGSSDVEWANWLLSDPTNSEGSIRTGLDPDTAVTVAKDLPPIAFHIRDLRLGRTPVNRFLLRRLSDLQHLEVLFLHHVTPPQALQELAAIKSLKTLVLGDVEAGDESLQPLSELTGINTLVFDGSKLTDAGLKSLAPLKNLTRLTLGGQAKALHGGGFEALRGLTNLRTLEVPGCGLDDEHTRAIGNLTELEKLDLHDTWISGKGLAQLAGLERLKYLNLSHCRRLLTDDFLRLGEFSALEHLDLSNCRISEASFQPLLLTLRKLKNLRTLNLNGTAMTPQLLPELKGVLPRLEIELQQPAIAQPSTP